MKHCVSLLLLLALIILAPVVSKADDSNDPREMYKKCLPVKDVERITVLSGVTMQEKVQVDNAPPNSVSSPYIRRSEKATVAELQIRGSSIEKVFYTKDGVKILTVKIQPLLSGMCEPEFERYDKDSKDKESLSVGKRGITYGGRLFFSSHRYCVEIEAKPYQGKVLFTKFALIDLGNVIERNLH